MNYILMAVIINTGIIYLLAWHGTTGALAWGFNIVLLDWFWQWLRFRQAGHAKSNGIIAKVVLGYLIRLASIVLLLKIGQAWLLPQAFWACAAFSLTIPFTSIFGSYMLIRRGFK